MDTPSTEYDVEFTPAGVKAVIRDSEAKSGDLLIVPIGNLRIPHGFNVRIHSPAYEDKIEEIKASIHANGFYRHKPLSGYAAKGDNGSFIYVVGGFTRLEAAKRAIAEGCPLDALPVILKPTGTSMFDLTLGIDIDNADGKLKPYERGIVVKRAVSYKGEEAIPEIAEKMNVTEGYVRDLLYLLGLPDAIQQMVIRGETSAGNAIATARRLGPAEAAKVFQTALVEDGPTDADDGVLGGAAEAPDEGRRPPTVRSTPHVTARQTGSPSKKVIFSAIDYAIALPGDGIDFLDRWRKGEADAVAELAVSLKKPKKAAPPPVATGKKRGRKSNAKKAAEAALAAVATDEGDGLGDEERGDDDDLVELEGLDEDEAAIEAARASKADADNDLS